MEKNKEIIELIKNIPPLSSCAMQLMQKVADENHQMNDIVKIVQTDPVLTASVLRVSNSAYFARREPVTSIDRAIQYLGDKMVVGIAMNDCAAAVYDNELEVYEAEKKALWRHSFGVALASKAVALSATSPVNSGEAFTAGLLHDIGKVVISEYMKAKKMPFFSFAEHQGENDFLELERKTIGTDHCEVGAELAAQWKLPKSITSAIRYHHAPQNADAEDMPLTFVVHLADFIAMCFGKGTGLDTMAYPLNKDYANYVKFSGSAAFEKLVLNVETEFRQFENAMTHV